MNRRYASIDIGTNTVLLLVAQRKTDGSFAPVLERAEITRLGRGVDRSGILDPAAIEDTLGVLAQYADQARALGAAEIAVCATSAARDAKNAGDFLEAISRRAGLLAEVISGDREAELTFKAAFRDFGGQRPVRPVVLIDIGAGSTEIVYGAPDGGERISFCRSFEVGSVRMTERYLRANPVDQEERSALWEHLSSVLRLPPAPPSFRLVGVAATVTSLYAVQHRIEPYDSARVHGGALSRGELNDLSRRLGDMPLSQRRSVRGLDPKRADVICAGAIILEAAMDRLGAAECVVSDRGLRWGLLLDRFGSTR